MRIAIVGTGGVGGYFGGRLAEAGEDVVFLARGAHLAAIRRNGLTVESVAGDFRIHPAAATDDPKEIGAADLAILAVKAWQVPEAAHSVKMFLKPGGVAIPLENGVEAPDQLAAELGKERALIGLCKISSRIEAPGVVHHVGIEPSLAFGELDGSGSERVERLREMFRKAKGVTVESPNDVRIALWQKFVFIAAFSGVGSATRSTAGAIRSAPETHALLRDAMRETQEVGRACGVPLAADTFEKTLKFFDDVLPPDTMPSMERDMLEGRPSELENQNGAVVRFGKEAGVPTPVNDFLYAALLPQEEKARGRPPG
ncbi:MAG: 2-dehydropantoate 2-reductase [Thermoanaerobaculia bacterium]